MLLSCPLGICYGRETHPPGVLKLTHETYTSLSTKFEHHLCFNQTIICFYRQEIGSSAEGRAGCRHSTRVCLLVRESPQPASPLPHVALLGNQVSRDWWASIHNVHIFLNFVVCSRNLYLCSYLKKKIKSGLLCRKGLHLA